MVAAFIVEGQMEQRIVQSLCTNAPVRLIGTNGKNVAMKAIASRVGAQMRLLRNCYPFVVLFDREQRQQSCDVLRQELLVELENEKVDVEQVIVGVADRNIENWILACSNVRAKYNIQGPTEGCNGKARLKAALHAANEQYGETTIGVELFRGIDVRAALAASASFNQFAELVVSHCLWIRKHTYN